MGGASSSVLRSSSGTSAPSWSSGSVVVPAGASGFSGDSGFTGSAWMVCSRPLESAPWAGSVSDASGVSIWTSRSVWLLLSISTLGSPLWVGSSETTPEEISALPPNRTAIPTAAATQSRQQTAMRMILFVLSVMVYASLVYFLLMGQYHIFLWKSIEKTG